MDLPIRGKTPTLDGGGGDGKRVSVESGNAVGHVLISTFTEGRGPRPLTVVPKVVLSFLIITSCHTTTGGRLHLGNEEVSVTHTHTQHPHRPGIRGATRGTRVVVFGSSSLVVSVTSDARLTVGPVPSEWTP